MNNKRAIILETVIIPLILTPIAFFLIGAHCHPKLRIAPPPAPVGKSKTVFGTSSGKFLAKLTLHQDGTAEGTVRSANAQDPHFRKNATRFGRTRKMDGQAHIIIGDLQASAINEEECAKFHNPVLDEKEHGADIGQNNEHARLARRAALKVQKTSHQPTQRWRLP